MRLRDPYTVAIESIPDPDLPWLRYICHRCHEVVEVLEIPEPYLDPEHFVCSKCVRPKT